MSSLADTLAILTPTPPPRVTFRYAVSGTRAAPNGQTFGSMGYTGTLMLRSRLVKRGEAAGDTRLTESEPCRWSGE